MTMTRRAVVAGAVAVATTWVARAAAAAKPKITVHRDPT